MRNMLSLLLALAVFTATAHSNSRVASQGVVSYKAFAGVAKSDAQSMLRAVKAGRQGLVPPSPLAGFVDQIAAQEHPIEAAKPLALFLHARGLHAPNVKEMSAETQEAILEALKSIKFGMSLEVSELSEQAEDAST